MPLTQEWWQCMKDKVIKPVNTHLTHIIKNKSVSLQEILRTTYTHRLLTSNCDSVSSSESVSLEWPFEDPVTMLWWFEQEWCPEAHIFEC